MAVPILMRANCMAGNNSVCARAGWTGEGATHTDMHMLRPLQVLIAVSQEAEQRCLILEST